MGVYIHIYTYVGIKELFELSLLKNPFAPVRILQSTTQIMRRLLHLRYKLI